MTEILVHGYAGKMGQEVVRYLTECRRAHFFGGVDAAGDTAGEEHLWHSFSEVPSPPDVIIDFSHHTQIACVMDYARRYGCAVVVATTALTEAEEHSVREAAREIPVFRSVNISLGAALLSELLRQAASALPEADIEIVESHHSGKADAPSGTALMLAQTVGEVRPRARVVTGRAGDRKRGGDEIGVHSLRMGNLVGEHTVYLTTPHQQLCLRHTAFDRTLFAEGAVRAACFLHGRGAGLYTMKDFLRG